MPNTNKLILNYFKKHYLTTDCFYVNSLIVSSFLSQHHINHITNSFINNYILRNDPNVVDFLAYLNKYNHILSIENLVEFFEFVISPENKETNGAVYTPTRIREYIISSILSKIPAKDLRDTKFADISCGCGGFFLTLAKQLHQTGLSYSHIYENNIYGVDIEDYSIERCIILLSLLAITEGEDPLLFHFNIALGNSLDFDWSRFDAFQIKGGFDVIIGNPPYVSSSKISKESKELLKNWSVASTGKTDLYIPFFQIAIEALNEHGMLGYITVNNFYRSLNGRAFRSYMSQAKYGIDIIDFGSEQVFQGRSTYTCICFIYKKQGCINYQKGNSYALQSISNKDFISIQYADVNDYKGWHLGDQATKINILKIESTGTPLGKKFCIKNGFATLKNNVYLFSPCGQTETCYILQDQTGSYLIERSICRMAIKPNILRHECDLMTYQELLIFPYKINENNQTTLIPEEELKHNYPHTYHYLLSKIDILKKRDKANREYCAWYAYGRTQALNIKGYKLLFPYLADNAYFILSENKDLLFYNGYAIVSESIRDLKIIQRILQSSIFWYYIKHTSKPYSGNYYALAKNYIKHFGIPYLSPEDEEYILKSNLAEIDRFLLRKYKISLHIQSNGE